MMIARGHECADQHIEAREAHEDIHDARAGRTRAEDGRDQVELQESNEPPVQRADDEIPSTGSRVRSS